MNYRHPFTVTMLIIASLALMGIGCRGGDSTSKQNLATPVNLTWWRATGTASDFSDIITDYQSKHPNVTVKVRIINPQEFKDTTTRALLAQKGPDIISLPNTELGAWRDALVPLPPKLDLTFLELSSTFGCSVNQQPTAITKTVPTLTLAQLKNTFIDAVANDTVLGGGTYGLPMSLDTLVMFYNRDLLAAANLPQPPATWSEFKNAVQRITKLDRQGRPLVSGAALGTADNVPYAADILSTLMLQNNTPMVSSSGTVATFNRTVGSGEKSYTPGADAVQFYVDFANPGKETYTWSADEPDAWEAFATGRVGFTFGYWRDYAGLKQRAPQVSIGVAGFPQIDGTDKPAYYTSYYLETVTKQSKHQAEAWDFIQFASRPPEVNKYLATTKQLTAVRNLVQGQIDDIDQGPAAKQLLSSKSWYHGLRFDIATGALLTLIRQVAGGTEITSALDFAARQVGQTLASAP